MKMIKKITSVFMTFLVMAALVIGSTSVVFAADKVDDTVKSTLVTTAEGLTDAIVQLKDKDIENYMSSGDDLQQVPCSPGRHPRMNLAQRRTAMVKLL